MPCDSGIGPNLAVVLGPTASGKTGLAVRLAGCTGGEIISADSRQVYRGMDIGTGKDLPAYGAVPLHLVDIRDPSEEFSLFLFQRECLKAVEGIWQRGKLPILAGGTGLYLESVLMGYRLSEAPANSLLRHELSGLPLDRLTEILFSVSPSLHNTTDLLDRGRLIRAIEVATAAKLHEPEPLPDIRPIVFGMKFERRVLRERIRIRLQQRLADGMIEEVRRLNESGVSWERLEFFGLEYRFVSRYLRGELSMNDMIQKLNSAINDFAKRQETWFRRMEKKGVVISWLDGEGDPFAQALHMLRAAGLTADVC